MRRNRMIPPLFAGCLLTVMMAGCLGPNVLHSSFLDLEDEQPMQSPFPDLRMLQPGVRCRLLVSTPTEPVVYEGTVARADRQEVLLANARVMGQQEEESGSPVGFLFGKKSKDLKQRVDSQGRATVPVYAINDILLVPDPAVPSLE